jgi:hypothetical protein
MNARRAVLVIVALCLFPSLASAATPGRRLALVVGANRAGADRVPLRYAVSDAERIAGLLTEMGGVAPADCVVLREPTRRALLDSLAVMRDRAGEQRPGGGRTEVVVYYSGHADEQGLLLGRETLTYRELKDAMHGISADVGIGILDACASGEITRLKGGRLQPGFLTDESMQMKGYAFLTSSSGDEAAQESERLKGSYFTHALLSGLRGAADASGDGRVTLNEAYQFAFNETLSQTATTQGGAQHPSYDIRMAGTGDVVITDVRAISCSIVLGPEFDGRFYVRNAKRVLVAELYKPAGRTVELGLEPGTYEIHYEQEPRLLDLTVSLADGERKALEQAAFRPVTRTATQKRGADEAPPQEPPPAPAEEAKDLFLAGRTRVELVGGFADSFVHVETGNDRAEVSGGQFGLAFSHWIREDFALDVQLVAMDMDVTTIDGVHSDATEARGALGLLFGVRYYFPPATFGGTFRPYAAAAIGPFSEYYVYTSDNRTEARNSNTLVGGQLGGGIDFQITRLFSLGLRLGVTLRDGHDPSFGTTFGVGFAWGQGRPRK